MNAQTPTPNQPADHLTAAPIANEPPRPCRCHESANTGCCNAVLVAQETWAHQACEARQDGALSCAEHVCACKALKDALVKLCTRWEKDAAQYHRQCDEARAKGIPCDQQLALKDALRGCAKDLKDAIKK